MELRLIRSLTWEESDTYRHEAHAFPKYRLYELNESEKRHFYKCERCGEMVDMRQLDDVLFHEDHVHRPEAGFGARAYSCYTALG